MFGVVPRTMWESRLPPDDRNRIPLGLRPLIVRGDRDDDHRRRMRRQDGREDARTSTVWTAAYHLDHALAEAGLSADDIDIVVASHLHFDHVGGFTRRTDDGRLVPRFPRARYVAHRQEWDDATHPHERNRASYLAGQLRAPARPPAC